MSVSVTIRRFGKELGVLLSGHLSAMGLQEGDSLLVVKTHDGIELRPHDPDLAETLEAGRDFMQRYPRAIKKLAD